MINNIFAEKHKKKSFQDQKKGKSLTQVCGDGHRDETVKPFFFEGQRCE